MQHPADMARELRLEFPGACYGAWCMLCALAGIFVFVSRRERAKAKAETLKG
jgi:hypothetical protein